MLIAHFLVMPFSVLGPGCKNLLGTYKFWHISSNPYYVQISTNRRYLLLIT